MRLLQLTRFLRLLIMMMLAGPAAAQVVQLRTGAVGGRSSDFAGRQALEGIAGPQGRALVIIRFNGPIEPGWLAGAEAAGARLHQYLPDNAYLASIEPGDADKLSAGRGLSWTAPLTAPLKIDPALAPTAGTGLQKVVILSVEGDAAEGLAKSGVKVSTARRTPMGWHETRANLTSGQIQQAARLWNVFLVVPEPVRRLNGERSAQTAAGEYDPGATSPRGPGYSEWLAEQGLTGGAGLVAQVMDDGLDRGDASNAPGTAHPDIVGRIAGIHNATSDPLGDSAGGHGHINAGIIMGDAASATTDVAGYRRGLGLAPAASVYATKIFRNDGSFDIGADTFSHLVKMAHDAGARFSNNSWGSDANGAYDIDSAEFDALTRDCDPVTPGHQPMNFFIAAGNSGPGALTVGAPGTAKNGVTVGAGENSDADGTDGCAVQPSGADSIRDLANFSSRGPNKDGRLGVTLFAVGTHVEGPASQSPSYDGTGVCDTFWPAGQTLYARSSGTSHSTPAACGAGMLAYEFFQTKLAPLGHTSDPSPALLKAALTTSATDMAGGNDGKGGTLGPVPSPMQGWGAVNMGALFSMRGGIYTFDQRKVFTASNQQWSKTIHPLDPSKPMKITLAWTDPPATPLAAKALVNDLDLVVTGSSGTFLGNVFQGGLSVTGGAADRVNNIEAVYIPNPSGPQTVTVKSFNIAGDALPGDFRALSQDFALLVWNGTDVTSAGSIELINDSVGCGQRLEVRLADSDLRGAGTAEITAQADSGDTALLMLTETSADSGVFTGGLDVMEGDPSEDGILQVSGNGKITVTYANADDGTGSPAVLEAVAAFNCSPPVITNVRVERVGIGSALITFDTNKPAAARVIGGLECGQETFNVDGGPGSTHTALVTGLASCARHRFRIEARDEFGSLGVNDNGGRCFSFVTAAEAPGGFNDSFDPTARPGWTHSAQYGNDNWAVRDNGFAHSPPKVFSFQPGPSSTESSRLVTPDVKGGGRLAFQHTYSFETTYDGARIEVSSDGGRTWQDLGPDIIEGGYNGRPAAFNDGGNGWTGGGFGPMKPVIADLSRHPGNIRIAFHFAADINTASGGWLIDDVNITEGAVCPSTLGYLALDKSGYGCGETVTVTLSDLNAEGDVIPVTLRTARGDEETLLLTDTGGKLYTGSIPIGAAGTFLVTHDGKIAAGSTDELRVDHLDTDDGDGGATPLTARATLSCSLQTDWLTEMFDQNDNDLSNQMFTFTPDGSPNHYAVCRTPITAFETDPLAGAVNLGFLDAASDDAERTFDLSGGAMVRLFGNTYTSIRVSDNGLIYFAPGGNGVTESLAAHFSVPRISALFDDLACHLGTGVFARQLDDRVVVSYLGVPEFGRPAALNSFQVEMFFDGRIRLSYLDIAVKDGLAGLSRGTGIPAGFVESDFSGYPTECVQVIVTPDRIRRYLLGLETDSSGLDLNGDGAIDAADLAGALGRYLSSLGNIKSQAPRD